MDNTPPALNKLLLAAFLSATFFLSPAMIPVAGMVLGYICPLPLIWVYLAHGRDNGRKTLIIALVMALGLAFLFSGIGMGITYIYHLGLAAGMGEAISRGKGRLAMIGWGILAGTLANIVLMLATAAYYGQAPLAFWNNYWQQVLAMVAQQVQSGGADPVQMDNVTRLLQSLVALAPSVMLIMAALVCWLNLWALNRLAKRPGIKWGYNSLTTWQAPEKLVWLFIALALIFWLAEGGLSWTALNLLLLTGTVYWFQGMAIANWWADGRNRPTWSRVIFLIVCFILPFLLFGVALMGLFDTWFNWRRLRKTAEQSGGLQ